MKLINNQTGLEEEFESDLAADAVYSGSHEMIADEDYVLSDETGSKVTAKGREAAQMINSGRYGLYKTDLNEILDQEVDAINEEGAKANIDAILGTAAGQSYGLSEMAGVLLPEELEKQYKDRIREARTTEAYQDAKTVSEIANIPDFFIGGKLIKGVKKGVDYVKKFKAADKAIDLVKGSKALTPIIKGTETGIEAGILMGIKGAVDYVSNTYIEDKPFSSEALTSEILKKAKDGFVAGQVLGTAFKATGMAAKSAKNMISKFKAVEEEVADSMDMFLNQFHKARKKGDVAAMSKASEDIITLFKKSDIEDLKSQGVRLDYDKDTNVWKYSDGNREVLIDADLVSKNTLVFDPKTLSSQESKTMMNNYSYGNSEAPTLDLDYADKLLNLKKYESGKVRESIEDIAKLNLFPARRQQDFDNFIAALRRGDKRQNDLADQIFAWRTRRDAMLADINKNGFLPRHRAQSNALIKDITSIQKGFHGVKLPWVNGKNVFTELKQPAFRKKLNETLDNVIGGYRVGDKLFVKNQQALRAAMLATSRSVIARKAKIIPEWQRHLIRWAGGGIKQTFKNKTNQQLADAAEFISKSGKFVGNFQELQQRAKQELADSVLKMNDAQTMAINNAKNHGIDIEINPHKVADFIDSLTKKYINKKTGTPLPEMEGFINFLKDKSAQWRTQVDSLGQPAGMPIDIAKDIREAYDKSVKMWVREKGASSIQDSDLKIIRSFLEDEIMNKIEAADIVSNKSVLDLYKSAKKQYATAKLVDDIVTNEANASLARNKVSLTAWLAMIGGATMAANTSGFVWAPMIAGGVAMAGKTLHKEQGDYFLGKLKMAYDKSQQKMQGTISKSVLSFISDDIEQKAAIQSSIAASIMIGQNETLRNVYEREKSIINKITENAKTIQDEDLMRISDESFFDQTLQNTSRAIDFLASKFPEYEMAMSDPEWHPSTDKMLSYLRYKDAVLSVEKIVQDFGSKQITKEQVETLKEIYPATHTQLYLKTIETIEGKRLKQQQKEILNKVFGIKMDSINSAKMMKYRSKGGVQEPQGRTRKVGSGQKFTGQNPTKGDRISDR